MTKRKKHFLYTVCIGLLTYCVGYSVLRTTHIFTHYNSWNMPTYADATESYHVVDVYGWYYWHDKPIYINLLRIAYWPFRACESRCHRWTDPKSARLRL
jgi:hypothetical protein